MRGGRWAGPQPPVIARAGAGAIAWVRERGFYCARAIGLRAVEEGEREDHRELAGGRSAAGSRGVNYSQCQSGPCKSPDNLFFPKNDRVSQKNSRVSRINMRFYAGV